MRILFLINSYHPRVGGAEQLVRSLSRELCSSGHRCIIVARLSGGAPFVERGDAGTVIRIPVAGPKVFRSMVFRALSSMLLVILRKRYDCIHAHSLDAPAVVATALGAFLGKKVYVTVHNTGKVAACLERFGGRRTLAQIVSRCSGMISINDYITGELVKAGCRREKIAFIPNGVDTKMYAPLPDDRRRRGLFKLGFVNRLIYVFVGNFHRQKGLDVLLEAWDRFHRTVDDFDPMLLLIGDGALMGSCLKFVKERGLVDSVRFLGQRNDVYRYLQLSDVFVQPSRWEGLSIALLEAMACGVAVIATPVGGAKAVIRAGVNGLFTRIDDSEELARIMKLLFEDTAARKRLGTGARSTVVESYSIAACARLHVQLFSGGTTVHGTESHSKEAERSDPAAVKRDEQAAGEEARELSGRLR